MEESVEKKRVAPLSCIQSKGGHPADRTSIECWAAEEVGSDRQKAAELSIHAKAGQQQSHRGGQVLTYSASRAMFVLISILKKEHLRSTSASERLEQTGLTL